MQAIGGYFELELQKNSGPLYPDLVYLNTGRNAFEYILKVRGYKKVFIPYFTCDALLEPLQKLQLEIGYYDVNHHLEASFDFSSLKGDEGILLTNYFGIKTAYIHRIVAQYPRNVIVDNAQALFSEPQNNVDTFYSPRKFVGIPDGGLLSIHTPLNEELETDRSDGRFAHLLKRIEGAAEEGYNDFKKNDEQLCHLPIKKMSKLTMALLESLNFNYVKDKRRANFQMLHHALKSSNELEINLEPNDVPMVYPYRVQYAEQLKQNLFSKRIYCATYWPNVLDWCSPDTNAYQLTKEIIPLPIDQRYGPEAIEYIIKAINNNSF